MKNYLQSFNLLNETDIEFLLSNVSIHTLKRGSFFLKENEICNEVAFVKSGILRSYYSSPMANEYTYCFTFPDQFMTGYSSFITGLASVENIQAMTDVELLVLKKNDISYFDENINGQKFLRTIAEQQYMDLEKRIFMYQKDTAKERYVSILKNYPQYVQQIPQQYLASFLAITPRHLSRLRKEINL